MLIAFEGPDDTGKSTAAKNLSHDGHPVYNATKTNHAETVFDLRLEPDLVQTFDRIDWFSHMVYRLALPDRDWKDERPRTVFAMPDTHLVVRLYEPGLANFTADEVVDTPIAAVNELYFYFADFFQALNEQRGFTLFKTVSLLEVTGKGDDYAWHLASFSSPATTYNPHFDHPVIDTDEKLLEFLREDDRQRL